ncbi:hypothetical protein L6452_06270 [Arctium lappa]|uniref:Uncharacterized protein n=1 Tax=Arctium lappa TaxID=4217 RepID=A0ACB9EIG0_ARCLA|nr:hypothetical protein L6452_06270 [Arctium lappa]
MSLQATSSSFSIHIEVSFLWQQNPSVGQSSKKKETDLLVRDPNLCAKSPRNRFVEETDLLTTLEYEGRRRQGLEPRRRQGLEHRSVLGSRSKGEVDW